MISRRHFTRSLAVGTPLLGLSCSQGTREPVTNRKVIVLGLDGLDPKIIHSLMQAGRAPNFQKLASMGSFNKLATTMPSLSPVAWSTFITGTNPGNHSIVDFIMRDPLTYQPYFSIWESKAGGRAFSFGDYELNLRATSVENKRVGVPFWTYLTEAGIPSTVIKIPTNFPVDESATRAISGMGTPDLADSFGRFSYYTSDKNEAYPGLTGGIIRHLELHQGHTDVHLDGPANTLRKDGKILQVPFSIDVDAHNDAAIITLENRRLLLQQGEYSDWVKVRFDMVPMLAGIRGICRFYLKEAHPHLRLYVTPINIDPAEQAMPVTHPPEVGGEIADHIGPFWTKGLPSDTKALDYRILDDEAYVKQAELILQDRLKLFEYEWSRYSEGLFFFYFSSTDQDAHMLWRNMDTTHPMHKASDIRFAGYIHHLYEEMDKLVGRVLEAAGDDMLVLVCSDHGFAPFSRQFHLNSWLREQGYLVLKEEALKKETASILDIDWSKTAAYGIGFNGLYMNRLGREKQGILSDSEASELSERIASELEAIRDPETRQPPVHRVYRRKEVYSGTFTPEMPELLIGYTPGYRNSSASVMGESGSEILNLNPWAWAGDHSMAHELVPGCLFSSAAISGDKNPHIQDLPTTILDHFGLGKPFGMQGDTLL